MKQIGVHRLFAITMIGFMANNVLPARLGEFVRAYALGRSETLPASLPFATIVIERIFDGFTLLLFLVGGLSFLRPSRTLLWAAGLTCGLYLGVLVGLMVLRTGRGLSLLTGALDRLPARLADPARRLLESFRGGLGVLSNGRALVLTAMWSLVIWLVNAAGVEATFYAFATGSAALRVLPSCSEPSRSPSCCRRRPATSAPSRRGRSRGWPSSVSRARRRCRCRSCTTWRTTSRSRSGGSPT